jgi:L-seryl-tRNA(Ser) seleniumtransferase
VTFSGGKGLRGPQSAGLLLGRAGLIEAARLNTSPNGDTIGRGMKVNKEEMLSMLVALELYLRKDHAAEFKEWERRADAIRAAAISMPGVEAEIYVPPIANHVPHIRIKWDPQRIKLTPPEVQKELENGEPRIMVRNDEQSLQVGVWMMRPGDEKVVAKRLRQVLRSVTPS